MPVPLIGAGVKLLGVDITSQLKNAAKAIPVLGGLLAKKSARYGGGDGPLYSTVNGFFQRVYAGDIAVINQLNQLRRTDADKQQWQQFWDTDMLTAVTTAAQRSLIVQLDPTKANAFPAVASNVKLTPDGPKPAGSQPFQIADLPALPNFTGSLPGPVQEAAAQVAAAVGTTSSTITWIALALGLVVVVKTMRR